VAINFIKGRVICWYQFHVWLRCRFDLVQRNGNYKRNAFR